MVTYKSYSDVQLLALLKKGDEAAFEEIFLRYDSLLFLYAYRKLGNKEEAKDIVQEVFISLWDNRVTFELKTYLSGYLYKSTLNKVLNVFKHQNIVQKYAKVDKLRIDVDTVETDFLIREKEINALIEAEIEAMPPRMREIYKLKRKEYLSTKEIAEQLNLSEMTVSTQMKRALKRLRMRFGLLVYILYILY